MSWKDFADLMARVQSARTELQLRPHQECFFRGHTHSSHRLLPSLFRRESTTTDQFAKLERRMFFEFRTRARQLYASENSDWDVLFHMQHHGVPTRLLDWTSVFGVALFFALHNYDPKSSMPCVWIMNPYALNHATWNWYRLFSPKYLARDERANRSYEYSEILLNTHPISWTTPLAIYSHQRSERMFAQSGWFTIHGTTMGPIESMFAEPVARHILKKIDVPHEAVPAARQFLESAGIGHRQLFPDLDGLARSIRNKYLSDRGPENLE